MKKTAQLTRRVLAVLAAAACTLQAQAKPSTDSPARQAGSGVANQLTAAERGAGWRLLFDGQTTTGWRGYKDVAMPGGWDVVEGTLHKTAGVEDILTVDQFGDFELTFDWKLATGGNAGVFYRGTQEYDHIYWSAPEFQLLDDAHHADGRNRLTSAGAAYALYPSPAGIVKPGGQWNSARILVRGSHVEHWLNGTKLLEYELWSPDWTAKVKASKFIDYPKYGRATQGYIGIQGDHQGELSLRNIKIREIK